jgi:integrase/recombinase XerD
MSTGDLLLRVECYVAVRKALGYACRSEEKLLNNFVRFLELNGASGPIRAQTAIEWVCAPAHGPAPSGQTNRLRVVRGFLSHLQAFEFETEVPGPRVLPPILRPLPYLYSPDEIAALMKEASRLGPNDSLRPHTYVALIGLLASSGLRVGEALRLKVEEVRLSCRHPHLQVVQTKFRKSRLVPLHPSCAEKIAQYAAQRKRLGYDALSDAFFVSEWGAHLSYRTCHQTFSGLAHRVGICKRPGTGRPGIHSLRHVFAVSRMIEWHRAGINVRDLVPHLSVYMGHVQPAHTYWYLTATPELLSTAAEAFCQYTQGVQQ